ncbi:unnamed protein product [Symbiodinium pilosum]|uniref:RNA-editing substrate-binding complex 6 protein domain-containing protein n=1 Tax=Symbiodinium pilosum TaxID=2952 RepID=A0A812YHW6_SYMPI|nr:unnamed protein product [Symbiodinium pilosum]
MYTPEVLKTENLTRYCTRLVAFGLHMPELLDRYAQRAEELAAQLQPNQFGLILNAFARASHRHDKVSIAIRVECSRNMMGLMLLHKALDCMLVQRTRFVPADIGRACGAYAKLRERDEVANAYARLDIRDELLLDDIADEVTLLLIANAFAHFKIRHRRLWPVLTEWLLQAHLDFRAQDVGTVLNALSAVDFHDEALVRTLLLALAEEPLLSEATPETLSLVFNALGRLRRPQPPDVEAVEAVATLAKHVLAGLGNLGPAGLMQLLHASARWKTLQSADLTEGILQNVGQRLSEFPAQSLCLLVHSCSRLQQRDVRLLTQVAKAIAPQLPQFTPQALALTAHGFAKIEVRSEILFYLLAEEIAQKMPLFSGQGVGMTLQSFGKLQINNKKLVRACIKHVRALSEELTLQEVDAVQAGLQQLEALDGSTDALLRSLRRKLQMQAYSPADDPSEASAESLLRKLSEEPAQGAAVSNSGAAQPTLVTKMPSKSFEPEDAATSDSADLWTLWSRQQAEGVEGVPMPTKDASETVGATPPAQLREYLTRPERMGRKATVVGGEAERATGGRKHGRRQLKAMQDS